MNWNIVEGNWKQFKGMMKRQWGKVADDPVDKMAGKADELAGKAQQSYGAAQDKVEDQSKK